MAVLLLGEVTGGELNRDATAKAVNVFPKPTLSARMQPLYVSSLLMIPVAASFVAGKLESGAFAWILSAPVEREKLLFTQIYSFTFALFALFFVNLIPCDVLICGFGVT